MRVFMLKHCAPIINHGLPTAQFIMLGEHRTIASNDRITGTKEVSDKAKSLGSSVLGIKLFTSSEDSFSETSLAEVLKACPNIQFLDLSSIYLQPSQIDTICALVKKTKVKDISFQYNQSISLKSIEGLLALPGLKKINLQKCPRVPSLPSTHPIANRPDLEVLTGGFLGYEV
jgi:hypothetical protein